LTNKNKRVIIQLESKTKEETKMTIYDMLIEEYIKAGLPIEEAKVRAEAVCAELAGEVE
jgi:hypothetical protein